MYGTNVVVFASQRLVITFFVPASSPHTLPALNDQGRGERRRRFDDESWDDGTWP